MEDESPSSQNQPGSNFFVQNSPFSFNNNARLNQDQSRNQSFGNNVGDYSDPTGLCVLGQQFQRMRIGIAERAQLASSSSSRNHQIYGGFRNNPFDSSSGIREASINYHHYETIPVSPQNFNSLENLRGRMVSMAKDQHGCKFLQEKLNEGNPQEIALILWEFKDHLHELMMDDYGNPLIQRIFTVINVDQMTSVLALVIRNKHKFKDVCIHSNGTRVIQKLLDHLIIPEQVYAVILALKPITVALTKSVNGGYVIQHCLKLFTPALSKLILDEVAENFVAVATDKSGCSVVQKYISQARGEAIWPLIQAIILSTSALVDDPYGNYVVQYLVKMRVPRITTAIMLQLCGKYDQLSMNKYASHVVEDLLEFCGEKDAAAIILEIMQSPNFLHILQDQFGNYVAQKALKISKGYLRRALLNRIGSYNVYLHSHLYGKKVLAFARSCRIGG